MAHLSFLWLNLIDRKNEKESIKKIVNDWIKKYGNYKKDIWNENLLSKRTMAWISNADIILVGKEDKFQKLFVVDDYVRALPTGSSKITSTGTQKLI